MLDLVAAFSASKLTSQFWLILLHPFVPIGIFVLAHLYLTRKGAAPIGSFWATTALVAGCACTPTFAMLAFAAGSEARVELFEQVMHSVKVGSAYNTLCKFSADHRGPRDVDWATNVLRDHVLWANDTSDLAAISERKPLPASEPIPCDRTPFADDRASRRQYSELIQLQTFSFRCFIITAFGSVYGSLMLLLPRRKRSQHNSENTTTTAGTVGAA